MVKLYARLIIKHQRTLDSVPERLRHQVSNLLRLWDYDDDGNKIGEETDK